MPTIIYHGTRAEAVADVVRLVGMMSGTVPDSEGIAAGLSTRMGMEMLGKIQDSYVTKSEGGQDEMGISWPALSPVTLALRRKGNESRKLQAKLRASFAALPETRKRLIAIQFSRLERLYEADRRNDRPSQQARRFARSILEKTKKYIPSGRYKKLKRQLSGDLPEEQAERLALLGAFALILRDTNRLLGSLSPQINSPDRILRIAPGSITVGSNVKTRSGINLLALHTSGAARKLRRDGKPKLPRRQVLPDEQRPMPASWKRDIWGAFGSGLENPALWLRLMGRKATVG